MKRKSKADGVNITNADEEQTLGCIHGKESLLVSPIIYWTEQDIWEFLNEVVRVPHCSLYDEGWHRIGCIGCPMSSHKQKMLENERYPHIKRGWISAIKAIRRGGEICKQIYLVEHPQGLDASPKRQRIAQDAGGYIKHPDPKHWTGLDSTNNPTGGGKKSQEYEEQQCRHSASASNGCGQTTTGRPARRNTGIWKLAAAGFQTAPLLTA